MTPTDHPETAPPYRETTAAERKLATLMTTLTHGDLEAVELEIGLLTDTEYLSLNAAYENHVRMIQAIHGCLLQVFRDETDARAIRARAKRDAHPTDQTGREA